MLNESPAARFALFGVASLVGALGVVVTVNRWRFARRVANETRALLGAMRSASYSRDDQAQWIESLPAPVRRYRTLAVGDRAPVRVLRIRHGGTFCMSPTGKARRIEGAQVFTAEPPGFIWTGRIRILPGLWANARDESVEGRGGMRVLLDDTITLVDRNGGSDIDDGSALRLLAEMVWYPTALFDERHVSWSPIDSAHSKATLRVGHVEVSGVFEFGEDGLPSTFSADRVHEKGELLPWGGMYRDYRRTSGMLVPFEAEVFWQLATGRFTYAHWLVDSMEYDEVLSGRPVRQRADASVRCAESRPTIWRHV